MDELGPVVIPGSKRFEYDSGAVGDRLEVTVATPPLYKTLADPPGMLVVTDAALTFSITAGVARNTNLLAQSVGFPPLVVVGIGYATRNLATAASLRNRDFTPTEAELPDVVQQIARHGLGGADRFLAAIRDEILPFVSERYRVDPASRTYVGYSLGGLFGLHALARETGLFRRHLLISPAVYYDDKVILRTLESADLAGHDIDVFLSVGALEQQPDGGNDEWPPDDDPTDAAMVDNLHALDAVLRLKGIGVRTEIFANEHHVTVFGAALMRGLMALYAPAALR